MTQAYSSYDYINQAKRATRNFRSEAPTFDGDLGPKGYVDWEGEINQFFEGCNLIEEKKCRLVDLKLVHQARLYWKIVERTIRLRGYEPIVTWRKMKAKLREKYLPMSYR